MTTDLSRSLDSCEEITLLPSVKGCHGSQFLVVREELMWSCRLRMDGLPAIQLTSLNVRSWPILLKDSVLKRAAISFAFQASFCTVNMRS